MSRPNGINIELTPTQYDYLYEVIMFAYEMEVPEQKGWDVQTYDNMVDNVTNGKSTILSNDVKGIMPLKYCLLYTSPSPRDSSPSRMPSSA